MLENTIKNESKQKITKIFLTKSPVEIIG